VSQLKITKHGSKISTKKHLKELHNYVGIYNGLEAVTPILIELGTLILEEVQQIQVAQERAQRQVALRERVAREAHRIADDYVNDWKQGASAAPRAFKHSSIQAFKSIDN
jgi:hypothetical protein